MSGVQNSSNPLPTTVNRPVALIQNPYARKRPLPSTCSNNGTQQHQQPSVKRTTVVHQHSYSQPPPRQQQFQGAYSASSGQASGHLVPQQQQQVSHNRNQHVNNNTTTKSLSSSCCTTYSSPPKQKKVDNNNNKRDSFDDPDFDWDAAIKIADDKVAQVESAKIKSPIIDPTQPKTDPPPTTVVRTGTNNNDINKPPPLSMHYDNRKPPPVPRNNNLTIVAKPPPSTTTRPMSSNGMASLRPSSWNNNSNNNSNNQQKSPAQFSQQVLSKQGRLASPAAQHQSTTTTNNNNNLLDPIMVTLPKELRFNRQQVKQPIQDSRLPELVKHANLSSPLANQWKLYPHQKRAILKGLQMRRFILALDMGLGKTLIGCVWAKAFQRTFEDLKILVICPVSLKEEWKRTAEEATELQVEEEDTKSKKKDKKKSTSANDDEKKQQYDTCIYPKVEIHSWAKIPSSVDSKYSKYIVIADEAHSIQSMDSARTKNFLTLAKPDRCAGVLLLTGTPMKNGKPSNLFPLLKTVRHPLGNHKKAYEIHFCAGRELQFGAQRRWDNGGSSNLEQLRELVSSHVLYLTKDECLKELPPARREHKHVPVSTRQESLYNKALLELARIHAMSSTMENSSEALLGAVTKLRKISAQSKVHAAVELAKKVLEEEPAVVIFSSFVDVAKAVHSNLASAGWSGELLTGETPPKKRQQMVDNFQEGMSSVFVCTFGAGGVGLTLTAARTIILVERPWTPGETHQAEDRVRRIGQKFAVRSIWISAFEMDKQIDAILEQKSQTSNTVLTKGPGGQSSSNGISAPAPKLSIFQLIRAILPGSAAANNSQMGGSTNQAPEKNGPCLSQTSMNEYYRNN